VKRQVHRLTDDMLGEFWLGIPHVIGRPIDYLLHLRMSMERSRLTRGHGFATYRHALSLGVAVAHQERADVWV